jgi:O-antigen/teichoic acid export membrane protein
MVRHVSKALGAGDRTLAIAHARLAAVTSLVLTLIFMAVAVGYGLSVRTPPLASIDLAFIAIGLFAYTYWRLYRTLLLAIGKAGASLKAEILSFFAMAAALTFLAWADHPAWVVGAFILVYVAFIPLTIREVAPYLRGEAVDAESRREFVRYNLYWFVSSGASLGAREIAVLMLDQSVERALVGEIAVALSLLMILVFAPRVIELPLVHELSSLAGKNDLTGQKKIAETAFHWMTVFTFALGCGTAILAQPILAIVAGVHTPVVGQAFALISLAFMAEMIVTPAANLMIASAHPGTFAIFGATSLAVAFAWWLSPWGSGALGVMTGLALSHLVRAIAIATYARARFGIALLRQPLQKITAAGIGFFALASSLSEEVNPWIAFIAFEAAMLILFASTAREVLAAVRRRGTPDAAQ